VVKLLTLGLLSLVCETMLAVRIHHRPGSWCLPKQYYDSEWLIGLHGYKPTRKHSTHHYYTGLALPCKTYFYLFIVPEVT